MKTKTKLILSSSLFITLIPTLVNANNSPRIYIDNKEVLSNAPIIIEDNRTLVPLRFISESLGANVNWNDSEKSIQITKNNESSLKIFCNSKIGIIENTSSNIFLEKEPKIINNRTYVPLRFITENFDLIDSDNFNTGINWNNNTRNINIYSNINNYDLSTEDIFLMQLDKIHNITNDFVNGINDSGDLNSIKSTSELTIKRISNLNNEINTPDVAKNLYNEYNNELNKLIVLLQSLSNNPKTQNDSLKKNLIKLNTLYKNIGNIIKPNQTINSIIIDNTKTLDNNSIINKNGDLYFTKDLIKSLGYEELRIVKNNDIVKFDFLFDDVSWQTTYLNSNYSLSNETMYFNKDHILNENDNYYFPISFLDEVFHLPYYINEKNKSLYIYTNLYDNNLQIDELLKTKLTIEQSYLKITNSIYALNHIFNNGIDDIEKSGFFSALPHTVNSVLPLYAISDGIVLQSEHYADHLINMNYNTNTKDYYNKFKEIEHLSMQLEKIFMDYDIYSLFQVSENNKEYLKIQESIKPYVLKLNNLLPELKSSYNNITIDLNKDWSAHNNISLNNNIESNNNNESNVNINNKNSLDISNSIKENIYFDFNKSNINVNNLKIIIKNKEYSPSNKPIIKNGALYLSADVIKESLEQETIFKQSNNEIRIQEFYDSPILGFAINENYLYSFKNVLYTEHAPMLINNTFYVSADSIFDLLKFTYYYDSNNNTLNIKPNVDDELLFNMVLHNYTKHNIRAISNFKDIVAKNDSPLLWSSNKNFVEIYYPDMSFKEINVPEKYKNHFGKWEKTRKQINAVGLHLDDNTRNLPVAKRDVNKMNNLIIELANNYNEIINIK